MKSKQLTLDDYQKKQISKSHFDWMGFFIASGFYFCLIFLLGGWIGFAIGSLAHIIIYVFIAVLNDISHR